MKLKAAIKIESIIAILVVILAGSVIYSSTKSAFIKAKESKTRSGISDLQGVLDSLVASKTNLLTYLKDCNSNGAWCKTDSETVSTLLLDESNPPEPYFSQELLDSTGRYLFFRATGKDSYLITGRSAKDEALCWVGSSLVELSNLTQDMPSACPE